MSRNCLVVWLALGLLGMAAMGCGATSAADGETTLPKQQIAEKQATPADQYAAELARGDKLFEKRDELPELEQAIAAYQSAAKLNPKDPEVWTRLARAVYLKADGFLSFEKDSSDEAMKRFLNMHERGIVYAKRALLAYSPEFQKKMQADEKMEEAVKVLDKKAAPALYWMASNYGKWGVAKGFTTILKYKDLIKNVMETVLKLDQDYFFTAANRYFGAYYAKTPSFAGGDMKKSKEHFETSLKKSPQYFGTKVLMAEYYAKKEDDKALFEKLLNEVLKGDPNVDPKCAPENRIEQRKAKALMAKIDDLF